MCKPIFVTGKAVVLYSGFCVENCITDIDLKGAYAISLIKKRH